MVEGEELNAGVDGFGGELDVFKAGWRELERVVYCGEEEGTGC